MIIPPQFLIFAGIAVFLAEQLPWITFAVLSAVILLLIRKEYYPPKIVLEASEEEKSIRELEEAGTLRREDAEKLLDSCTALPEVREVAPEPDLPLKLVSAISRIFAWMKIIFLVLMWTYFLSAIFCWNSSYHTEDLPLLIATQILTLCFSCLELHYAKEILRGSFPARLYLAGIWLFDFLLPGFIVSGSIWIYLILYPSGFFALYVLLRHIAALKKRFAVYLFAVCAAAAGIWFHQNTFHFFHTIINMSASFRSISGPVRLNPEGFLLIQGDPERETAQLTEEFAKRLRNETKLPVRVQKYEEKLLSSRKLELILLFQKHHTVQESFLFKTGNQEMRQGISKISKTNRQVFHVRLLKNLHHSIQDWNRLNLPGFGLGLELDIQVSGGKQRVGRAAANVAFNEFRELLKDAAMIPTYRFPEQTGYPESTFVPDIPLPHTAEKIYSADKKAPFSFCLYRLPVTPGCNFESLEKTAQKAGYCKNGRESFSKRNKSIFYFGQEGKDGKSDNLREFLAFAQHPGSIRDPKRLEQYRKSDFRSFVLAGGLRLLKGEDLKRALEEFRKLPNLTIQETLVCYDRIADSKEIPSSFMLAFFQDVADRVFEKPEEIISNLPKLISAIPRTALDEWEYLRKKLGKRYHSIRITEKDRKSQFFEIEEDKFDRSIHLLEIFPEDGKGSSIRHILSVSKHQGKWRIASGSITVTKPGFGIDSQEYYTVWEFKRNSWKSSTSGERTFGFSGRGIRKNEIEASFRVFPKEKRYRIRVRRW